MTADPIPCVHGLRESYGAGPAPVRAVRGSDLDVAPARAQLRTRRADSGSVRRPELISSHDSSRRAPVTPSPPSAHSLHRPTTDHPTERDWLMAAVLYRLRAALRTDWRSLVVVTLLVGVAGGAVLSAVNAASRTASAYAQMRQATNAWDVLVNPNNGAASPLTMAEIRSVPGVETVGREDGVVLYPSFIGSLTKAFAMPPILIDDRTAGYQLGRPLMVSGRQPAPGDPNGVWVERTFALAHHLHVGQTFTFTIITPQLLNEAMKQGSEAKALAMVARAPAELRGRLRIDGIGITTDDVVVDPGYQPGSFELTPAFRAAHPQLLVPYWGAEVKLAPGASMNAFTARVRALDPDESIAFQRASAVAAEVDQATGPQVTALDVFAALAALLGLVVVSQAFSRRMQEDGRQYPILAAMGMTRPERMAASMAKALLAVAAGTVLAIVLTILTSGLGPVGVVRIAEVHPGLAVDWPLLLVGGAALLLVGSLLAAVPAWRWSRSVGPTGTPSRSRVAASVAAVGGSPAAVIGVRFGLETGAGPSSAPVRTTILGRRHSRGAGDFPVGVLRQPRSPGRHPPPLR